MPSVTPRWTSRSGSATTLPWHGMVLGLVCVAVWSQAATVREDFGTDPAARGWRTFGDTRLFSWSAEVGNLSVTWDSSQLNSFFYLPLNVPLLMQDDFHAGVDLVFEEIAAGIAPEKPHTFQIAFGFIQRTKAFDPDFHRSSASEAPNLVEWDYFPDTGLGATVSPVLVTRQSRFYPAFTFPLPLDTQVHYHIELTYTAANRTLTTTMTADGLPLPPIAEARLPAQSEGFCVDAFSLNSYSDEGGDPRFRGSVYARGTIDNITLTVPDPPVFSVTLQPSTEGWVCSFPGSRAWTYTLEASDRLAEWTDRSGPIPGDNQELRIPDPEPAPGARFYRVRADRP